MKSRSSWHTTISHPYSIFKGVGIIIEGVDIGIEATKFPGDLRKDMLEKFAKLPKEYRDKLTSIVEDLSTQDIGSINPHQLISLILNEYDITLR